MLENLFETVVLGTMGFDKSDLSLIEGSETDVLIKVTLNNVECGLLSITTKDSLERPCIILSNFIKQTIFDFFIILNDKDLVVMFTDHKGRLFPQYIPLKNTNQIELICGKPFIKNLIANRGVEFYGIN